jgi:uncharacterized membrane protein YedE/YeeE
MAIPIQTVASCDVSLAEGEHVHHEPKPYSNPYLTGLGLGLVLLAAFVLMGRGLGASGAISSLASVTVETVAPEKVASNSFYQGYLQGGMHGNSLKTWLMFQVMGLLMGGFLSAALANRLWLGIEKGPRISKASRLFLALLGGGLMGVGAKFARGCTSGQALSGGAVLNAGSWAFMMMVFAGAYALAYFLRRQWR